MARQKASAQVETLRKQQQELAAKLQEAKKRHRDEEREKNRRKCELAGAVALKEFDANPSGSFGSALRDLLHTGITKAADRAQFGLPPLTRLATAGGGQDGGG